MPPQGRAISAGQVPPVRRWIFSFRFWRQAEHFGMRDKDHSWFISLLEKLAALSAKGVSEVMTNPAEKKRWRLHEINWDHSAIPITRADLNWVERKYLENEDEFPFWQFSVSLALGRIVGFWDEEGTFNIVLLDPSHNIQPSAYSDYKVRPAPIAQGEFSEAALRIDLAIAGCGDGCGCKALYGQIQQSLTYRLDFSTMLVCMDDATFDLVATLIANGAVRNAGELMQLGVDALSA